MAYLKDTTAAQLFDTAAAALVDTVAGVPPTGNRRRRLIITGVKNVELAKQSTAKTFLVGPILDADGAAVTSALTATDVIKVTKNGTVGAADAQDTLTHDHTGHYKLATDGGDFDTLGEVEFTLNSGTNAMQPVKFLVLPAAIYDSLVAGTATADGLVLGSAAYKLAVDSAGKVAVPDAQKVDVNTIKTKGVTVDVGGTTFPASIHASGAAVAKSPATVAAGDGVDAAYIKQAFETVPE